MWYERWPVVVLTNIIGLSVIGFLSFSTYGFSTWQPYVILLMALTLSVYNSAISYFKTIDMTVNSLAKHYEKQLMVEIKKAVDKAMGM